MRLLRLVLGLCFLSPSLCAALDATLKWDPFLWQGPVGTFRIEKSVDGGVTYSTFTSGVVGSSFAYSLTNVALMDCFRLTAIPDPIDTLSSASPPSNTTCIGQLPVPTGLSVQQSLVGWFLALPGSVSGDMLAPLAMVGGTMVNMASPATSTSGFGLSTSRPLGLGEFRLDGANDYIQVTQAGHFTWHALPFTMALWVRDDVNIGTSGSYSHRFISWCDGTNNIQLGLTTDLAATSTKRIAYVMNAAATAQPQAISAGDLTTGWHHIAATYDGLSSYKVYVDGFLSAGNPTTVGAAVGVQLTDTANLFFGQRGDGIGFVLGQMDDMRLYGRELSATEIYWAAQGR